MSFTTTPQGPQGPQGPGGPQDRQSIVIPFPQSAIARKVDVTSSVDDSSDGPGADALPHGGAGDGAIGGEGAGPSASADAGPRLDASGLPVERFWNLPNSVTMLRTGVVPILLFLPMSMSEKGSEFMAWAFIIAALTDWLDGYLARRDGGKHVTRIGKLLDPLADKMIVSTALIMLLAVGRIPIWGAGMVVVIVGRELAVTGLRGIASSQGQTMAATGPGKLKTIAQNAAIGALLFHYETIGLPAHEVGMTLLAVATALTLWSGYLYFAAYFGWQGRLNRGE